MRKLIKSRQAKIGLPPGTPVHVGERKAEGTRITIIEYDEGQFREEQLVSLAGYVPSTDRPTVEWVNVDGLHQVEMLEALGERFGLHPLVIEDILNTT